LPERTKEPVGALTGDMSMGLQAVESRDDRWDVAQERLIVEAGVEVGEG
jgi:hypothetical protein